MTVSPSTGPSGQEAEEQLFNTFWRNVAEKAAASKLTPVRPQNESLQELLAKEAQNVADRSSSSQSDTGYVRYKLANLRQASSEGVCRPVPDEVPVSSCPIAVVIGDSDEDIEAAEEIAANFESDVTISVDDQFETGEKLRNEVSVGQCFVSETCSHTDDPSGPADS